VVRQLLGVVLVSAVRLVWALVLVLAAVWASLARLV
jgi:hypothetical protein